MLKKLILWLALYFLSPTIVASENRTQTVKANQETLFKAFLYPDRGLLPEEKCVVPEGTDLTWTDMQFAGKGHYRVRLVSGIESCHFREGYIAAAHYGLDSPAPQLQVKARQNTWFKLRITDRATNLLESEKCFIAAGTTIPITTDPFYVTDGHYKVNLAGSLSCSFSSGLLYGPHFGLSVPVSSDSREISVDQDITLKLRIAPTEQLSEQEQCRVPAGSRLFLAPQLQYEGQDHFKVHIVYTDTRCPHMTYFADGRELLLEKPDADEFMTITATVNTAFKRSIRAAGTLRPDQKCTVLAGTKLKLSSSPEHLGSGHFRVEVVSGLPNSCLWDNGIIYGPHVGISIPEVIKGMKYVAGRSTVLKLSKEQSQDSEVDDGSMFCSVVQGETIVFKDALVYVGQGHYKGTLAQTRTQCKLTEVFVYGPHFNLKNPDRPVAPKAVVFNLAKSTVLKLSIGSEDVDERCVLPAGGVAFVDQPVYSKLGHFRVMLANPDIPCPFRSGYIYGPHFGLSVPSSDTIKWKVPYFCQNENELWPGSTCNVTSLAMVLNYFGDPSTPDDLSRMLGEKGTSIYKIRKAAYLAGWDETEIYDAFEGRGTTMSHIRDVLANGSPLVLGNDFTQSGHYVTVIGFNKQGLFVHDPYGQWGGVRRGGYNGRLCPEFTGRDRFISYLKLEKGATRGDYGQYHVIVPKK